MYLDIKEIKAMTARACGAKIGSTTMMPIISKIKAAAVNGKTEVRIDYKDYPLLDKERENIGYLETWAHLCGYVTMRYDNRLYIRWY